MREKNNFVAELNDNLEKLKSCVADLIETNRLISAERDFWQKKTTELLDAIEKDKKSRQIDMDGIVEYTAFQMKHGISKSAVKRNLHIDSLVSPEIRWNEEAENFSIYRDGLIIFTGSLRECYDLLEDEKK